MKINFYPEYDNTEFEKAAKEYAKIWNKEGEKITTTIENVSKLKFKEKIINAIIYKYISYSSPLQLEAEITIKHKRGTLVHELCHRLISGNAVKINVDYDNPNHTLEVHKIVDLILYDAFIELYGENFAIDEIKFEKSRWDLRGVSPYKIAWDWALSMSKEERQREFKKYLPK